MTEEKELLEKYKLGDKHAFETLVKTYRAQGERFAMRFINDVYGAQDIVQEAFVHIYITRTNYKMKSQFKTYLFTIIRNKSVDYIRKQAKLVYDNDIIRGNQQSPESELLNSELGEMIYKALDELSKPYKTSVYLIDVEGLSYKEAAKIMGKSVAAFKVTLHRARHKMKMKLEKEVIG